LGSGLYDAFSEFFADAGEGFELLGCGGVRVDSGGGLRVFEHRLELGGFAALVGAVSATLAPCGWSLGALSLGAGGGVGVGGGSVAAFGASAGAGGCAVLAGLAVSVDGGAAVAAAAAACTIRRAFANASARSSRTGSALRGSARGVTTVCPSSGTVAGGRQPNAVASRTVTSQFRTARRAVRDAG